MTTLIFRTPTECNWDIYANNEGKLLAKAKPSKLVCKDSYYGDKHHLLKLMKEGYFKWEAITEAGLEMFQGIHSALMTDSTGKKWHWLRFN